MPKEYAIGDNAIKLYTVSELAKAARRDPMTVRRWEKAGVIPKPAYTFKGRRLYTLEQVKLVAKLRVECALKRGRIITDTEFAQRVAGNWQ